MPAKRAYRVSVASLSQVWQSWFDRERAADEEIQLIKMLTQRVERRADTEGNRLGRSLD
jgi:hypothetical protein